MQKRLNIKNLIGLTLLIFLVGVTAFWFLKKGESTVTSFQEEVSTQSEPILSPKVRQEEPELDDAEHRGSIQLTTQPEGAKVEIQIGEQTIEKETPVTMDQVVFTGEEVEIAVKVSKAGYVAEERFFLLTENLPSANFDITLAEAAQGRLSVQAIPWGRVGINQKEKLRETPLIGYPLKPGRHRVWVFHPPTEKWLSASIAMDPGGNVRCIANFSGAPAMQCR